MTLQRKETTEDFSDVLQRAREGNTDARETLFRACYPEVERLVHARLKMDYRSQRPWLSARFSTGDIVQEVFRSVIERLPDFVGSTRSAFVGFLSMVIRNRIHDAIRFHEATMRDGRRMSQRSFGDLAGGTFQDPSEYAEFRESVLQLNEAMGEIAERDRLLLRARLEHRQSFTSLAVDLGFPNSSAARRAFYAAKAQVACRVHLASLEGGDKV